jgi:hypothetical protein
LVFREQNPSHSDFFNYFGCAAGDDGAAWEALDSAADLSLLRDQDHPIPPLQNEGLEDGSAHLPLKPVASGTDLFV